MPALMSVAEFIEETREDFQSPTTSTFTRKMSSCRQTIGSLEEVRIVAPGLSFLENEVITHSCLVQEMTLRFSMLSLYDHMRIECSLLHETVSFMRMMDGKEDVIIINTIITFVSLFLLESGL